jgi:UDP-glucose 4-epimerase
VRELRRALVTGCAGFIGSHLTEALLAGGISVVGVDCFNANYGRAQKLRNLEHAREWQTFEFVPIDLARGELDDVVAEVDTVFHLAAEPGVRSSWGSRFERYVANNLMATHHLLNALMAQPMTRMVNASSSSIYGQARTLPTSESTVPAPVSPYGVTKLGAEHLCHTYHVNHGLEVVSLRYFTVFGPRQRPDMAINRFCTSALHGEEIVIYGDGRQTRDFTYVADIVDATVAAATADLTFGTAYNVGGGLHADLRAILATLDDLTEGRVNVMYGSREYGDVQDTCADTTLARRDLAFDPQTTLRDGLASELEWVSAEMHR